MKELYEEKKYLNLRIGETQSEIRINEEKYGKENAEFINELLRERITEWEKKIEILNAAEEIILGIR